MNNNSKAILVIIGVVAIIGGFIAYLCQEPKNALKIRVASYTTIVRMPYADQYTEGEKIRLQKQDDNGAIVGYDALVVEAISIDEKLGDDE